MTIKPHIIYRRRAKNLEEIFIQILHPQTVVVSCCLYVSTYYITYNYLHREETAFPAALEIQLKWANV